MLVCLGPQFIGHYYLVFTYLHLYTKFIQNLYKNNVDFSYDFVLRICFS